MKMYMTLFYDFSILIQLSIFVVNQCVFTAIVDRLHRNRLNSIDDGFNDNIHEKYDKTNKCEIRIVTNGICSVNSHLVKPTIRITREQSPKEPVYSKPKNEERVRNMRSFSIEEQNANNLVDEFLVKFKDHFSEKIDPLSIPAFGMFKVKKLGLIKVYELSLRGISHMKRQGSVRIHTDSQMKLWSINANLSIDNITADFNVDAKLKNRVFIKRWTLQVLIEKCLLNSVIEFNVETKMMSITSLTVHTIEGFTLNSENLSWPFSLVAQHIIDYQMNDLKTVISNNAHKYLNKTVSSFDVTKIFNSMTNKDMMDMKTNQID